MAPVDVHGLLERAPHGLGVLVGTRLAEALLCRQQVLHSLAAGALEQVAHVVEVAVEDRPPDARLAHDLVHAELGVGAPADQLGGGGDDPLAALTAALACPDLTRRGGLAMVRRRASRRTIIQKLTPCDTACTFALAVSARGSVHVSGGWIAASAGTPALLAALAALALPAGAGARPASAAKDGRPNILVVMTDDQAQADVAHMPNVKRLLARRGTTFADAIDSFPLCCPARATFITGQYAHNHSVGGQLLAVWLVRHEAAREHPAGGGCRRPAIAPRWWASG